ncbi:Ca2+-transporting ATPase [Aliiruegeria haliotis]|uniref:Ca2+-transporting ATPase n=1 Tax=Aliiruegeria haliotis TaxID=1280846 RepID=A0A2T0RN93_9RHOB|nr:cation-transporting P-type ATPase [Aliiruegeria haliotis]PRY22583.1 Ca2+-transporting ATPase [Aliiruegeria haliotis]
MSSVARTFGSPQPDRLPAWSRDGAEVASDFSVTPSTGLDPSEAARRRAETGPNRLAEAKPLPSWVMFLRQFASPLLIILIAGSMVSALTGHRVDAVAILAIAIFNAFVTHWQEHKAAQSLAALRRMSAPWACVRRGGRPVEIPAADIVPGDILIVKAGDILAADIRFLVASRVQVNESTLTGESEPVDKQADPIPGEDVALADRSNMGLMSTQVTGGSGEGIVVGTGMDTEVGRIADLMTAAKEPKTPLQLKIGVLSRVLVVAALIVVAIVIGVGVINGMGTSEMLNTAISLSVAAIPEGLPTVVTIVLTLGARNMAASNALARRLSSVETLGSTSVICTDKTGTLTQNQMQVMRCWVAGKRWDVTGEGFYPEGAFVDAAGTAAEIDTEPDLREMLSVSALCNDAQLVEADGRPAILGNPTEGALVVAAAKVGISRQKMLEAKVQILRRFPFDATRKMMSVVMRFPDGRTVLGIKGAPDVLLSRSSHLRIAGETLEMAPAHRDAVEAVIASFASEGLRTLAVAIRDLSAKEPDQGNPEKKLVLLGIYGIMDPPRAEVPGAVAEARRAGIRTVMITGDHAVTARAIAGQIGIRTGTAQTVHKGVELDLMSDENLTSVVRHAAVFARVTPEHKLRIVRALQRNGEVTAMTGDGVNDAPALRAADIGVAMGLSGTQVGKDSAALVLLDDNFATIVTAVREGRRIYDNLLKFIRQELTANVAEVTTILFAFLLMGANPLLPVTPLMILWVNLVSDGLPALTLGFEAAEPDLMSRPPRPRNEDFFAAGMKERILIRGTLVGLLTFYVFRVFLEQGATLDHARTAAFMTLIFAQIWHVFDARTTTTLFRKSPLGNRTLLGAVAASILLSLLATYTGAGHVVLGTASLPLPHLVGTFFLASLPTLLLSGIKEVFGVTWL